MMYNLLKLRKIIFNRVLVNILVHTWSLFFHILIRKQGCRTYALITPIRLIVSPDESRGYLGFTTVMPPQPLQRYPFGRDNLKNILVRPFKLGMWVYMGNATNAIVL